ncbi:MAG TPA: single-stranded DNA-binding protein [Candidatus Sulfotelmatobacter sp.]|nr:single-stranded DNA-binding protein [Candidatus Sulfotelmatobacter sp.]
MGGLNRSILAGRLVADPEVRYTGEEKAVTHFRLAINRGSKKKGTDTTDFIRCVAFGGLAKICGEYLKKGRLVAVEGRLRIGSYEGKDGQKKSSAEVIVDDMQMLDFKFYNAASKAQEKSEAEMVEV